MSDPCETLVQSLALLQKQRERFTESLASGNGNSIAIHKQLQSISAAIVTVNALLRDCRQNSDTPAPIAFCLAEHNQTIQFFEVPYFSYPVVGQIPPQNNTVPLVSKKETMVRLYIDAPAFPAVTGTLRLLTSAGNFTVPPLASPVAGRSLDAINRLDLSQTLNFVIPRVYCDGDFSYIADIVDVASGAVIASPTFRIAFVDVPPVKVHCVLIHYTGLDFFDNPVNQTVNFASILTALDGVLATYPLSDFDFDGCEVIQWDKQMKFDQSWSDLLDQVSAMRDQSGSDAIYLGFVPEEANCGGVCGKGVIDGGACIFRAGPTMNPVSNIVHEMGHAIGRKHAPECLPSGQEGDTGYPQYGPLLPRASIGGIGLDMRDLSPAGQLGAIMDPTVVRDYMSYCGAVWTSPYGYLFALDRFRSGRFTDVPAHVRERREFYFIAINYDRSARRIQIKSAFHLPAAQSGDSRKPYSRVRARIYAENDLLLCETYATVTEDDIPALPENLKLTFARMPEMSRLVLSEEETALGEMRFADKAPQLRISDIPKRASDNRWLKVAWKGSAARDVVPPLVYSVRYSINGTRWRVLAVNTSKTELLIDLDSLPGGPECRVQVIASAGLRTTVQESESFTVAVKPRSMFIQRPIPDSTHLAGHPISCAAASFSPDFGSARGDEIYWTSARFGFLGAGNVLTLPGLPAGKHWIQVQAPDGIGAVVSRQIGITVQESPCGDQRPAQIGDSSKGCGCHD